MCTLCGQTIEFENGGAWYFPQGIPNEMVEEVINLLRVKKILGDRKLERMEYTEDIRKIENEE